MRPKGLFCAAFTLRRRAACVSLSGSSLIVLTVMVWALIALAVTLW